MYQKILAPLDGSELSECSLEHVKAIATGCKTSEVALIIVLEEQLPIFEYSSAQMVKEISEQREKEQKEVQKSAEDYLAKVAGGLGIEGIAVKTAVRFSLEGGVADEILDYVQNNKIDMIIMSTHGRSGISRWAFGSVTDKVVSHAKVPVLTVTAAGCRVQ